MLWGVSGVCVQLNVNEETLSANPDCTRGYRVASLIRNCNPLSVFNPLGPYSRIMSRALWWS